ncbi:MAG: nuclear transport factor 2 family protein, partial [Mycetocola sp.]
MKQRKILLSFAVGVLALAGCSAQGSQTAGDPSDGATPSSSPSTVDVSPIGLTEQEQQNAALVTNFFTQVFVDGEYRQAADRFLSEDYIQHSPEVAGGAEGFISGMGGFLDATPELSVSVKRVLAEGDLVLVHSHMVNAPGEQGSAVMDIFRVEDDVIAEHWDAVQAVPAESANGHTMFDGTTTVEERSESEQDANT